MFFLAVSGKTSPTSVAVLSINGFGEVVEYIGCSFGATDDEIGCSVDGDVVVVVVGADVVLVEVVLELMVLDSV